MAFKVLNNEEMALLNDNQRKYYERELYLYKQRVAFVEKIEMIENAHIEPYEPKLEPIYVINEVKVKSFKKTEPVISMCEPVAKPDLQIKPFAKIEQTAPMLPLVSIKADVQDRNVQIIEKIQPKLPTVIRPKIAVTPFKRLKNNQPDLPAVNSPSMQIAIPFEKLKDNLHHTPDNIPNVVMPDIDIDSFAVPVKSQPSLPEVSVYVNEVKAFVKPEIHSTKLPTFAKPNFDINYVKEMKPVQTVLPEISESLRPIKVEFNKPDQRNAVLPTFTKPDLFVKSFNKTELATPNLPTLSSMSLQTKEFTKPENIKLDLPTVSDFKVEIKTFEKPESKNLDLPNIVKTNIKVKSFERHERIQTNIAAPEVSSFTVKEFTMAPRNIMSLPEIKITEAPDATSVLKMFFASSEN